MTPDLIRLAREAGITDPQAIAALEAELPPPARKVENGVWHNVCIPSNGGPAFGLFHTEEESMMDLDWRGRIELAQAIRGKFSGKG